ncbi:MAG: helix-turn-helix domain-containing protein [Actinomycetota bacterium]|nr:helix-turn-helix domain-containing protein [Actinomycetota bacterium]MDA8209488.1 helix-turn-helix domain-containing protein [Actinomycetota bacterium]
MTTADLLLHPIRLRILQAFLGDRALTTAELKAELPEIPAASLYRHLARLVEGGVLSVISERRVRGATERTYVLRNAAASVSIDELEKMTPEQHLHAFVSYLAGLLAEFERYVATEGVDPVRDGGSYRLAAMWLDDAEVRELSIELARVLQPRLANAPREGRRRWVLGTVVVPGTGSRPGTR